MRRVAVRAVRDAKPDAAAVCFWLGDIPGDGVGISGKKPSVVPANDRDQVRDAPRDDGVLKRGGAWGGLRCTVFVT
tara:strand:- start:651 stop:878 length:228 start_codon:yes stop_codon:yes gene_type:complete